MMTTKLLTVFDVYETESQALESFARESPASMEAVPFDQSTNIQNANSLKEH
jgi:uncharacterized protein with beta-barrel porin domain